MIDIENRVYTLVKETLGDIDTSSKYISAPSVLPHVSVIQTDSVTYRPTRSNTCNEEHATLTFEVNVYTADNKAQAKEIIAKIDDLFIGMDFERDMLNEIPNEQRGIYRIFARYMALVSHAVDVEGIPTYYIFRR